MKQDLQIDPALLPALATFECVARHANFSRAAAEMGLSPSALSQSVRALEKRLGVRLLARTTRRVSLTEEGALILDGVRRGLAELGGALSALGDVRGQPAGTVRIALSRIAYAELFSPHIVDFSALYPGIGLEFYLDDGLTDIVAGRFDIGVRLGSCIEADMVAVALRRPSRMRIVGTPDYFLRHPPPRSPEDLAAHDCVRFRFTTSGRIARWDLERNGQRLEIEVSGRFVVNDFVAEIDLARRGLALAQVVESTAMDDIETGRLVTTLDEYAPTLGAAHLYFPGTTHMPARLRVFIDYFQAANSAARKATN